MISPAATGSTLVDFKIQNQGLESPFLYDGNNAAAYPGCGAIKTGGYWII